MEFGELCVCANLAGSLVVSVLCGNIVYCVCVGEFFSFRDHIELSGMLDFTFTVVVVVKHCVCSNGNNDVKQ
jgi:hypothetical protein